MKYIKGVVKAYSKNLSIALVTTQEGGEHRMCWKGICCSRVGPGTEQQLGDEHRSMDQ